MIVLTWRLLGLMGSDLTEQFADEFAQRLVGRAVTVVIDVIFQVIHQLVGGRVTAVQIAGKAMMQDVVELVINPRIQRAEVGDGLVQDAAARFLGGFALEEVPSQQEVRQHHPDGEKVGTLVGDLKIGLLGAHVIGLAGDDFAFLVGQKAARLGHAEIGQLHVALEGDHDVFEADIAVDDAQRLAVLVGLGVRVGQAAGHAAGDEHGEFTRQYALFISQLPGELFEIHAADQFHGDEINAIGLAEMIGLDNVRVDQVGDELGLADEILDEHLLARVIGADDLDGNALHEIARAVLLGFINDAHAALKNFADDFVAELALDRKECHARMV